MTALFKGRSPRPNKNLKKDQSVNDKINFFTAMLNVKKATLANFNEAYGIKAPVAEASSKNNKD